MEDIPFNNYYAVNHLKLFEFYNINEGLPPYFVIMNILISFYG